MIEENVEYIYVKPNETITEFTSVSFPQNWNDTLYQFISMPIGEITVTRGNEEVECFRLDSESIIKDIGYFTKKDFESEAVNKTLTDDTDLEMDLEMDLKYRIKRFQKAMSILTILIAGILVSIILQSDMRKIFGKVPSYLYLPFKVRRYIRCIRIINGGFIGVLSITIFTVLNYYFAYLLFNEKLVKRFVMPTAILALGALFIYMIYYAFEINKKVSIVKLKNNQTIREIFAKVDKYYTMSTKEIVTVIFTTITLLLFLVGSKEFEILSI